MPGTDLRYVLESKAIYEYITVSSPDRMRDAYEFELKSETLKPVLQEDGSIGLYAGEEEQLYMPPAYMKDSAGEISTGVKAELYEENGSYILRYTPDRKWLEAPGRAWPVAIDPTIWEYRNMSNIHDNAVYTVFPGNGYRTVYTMRVGWDSDYGYGRLYIKWNNLPRLSAADVINSAAVSFHQYEVTGDSVNVKAYAVSEYWDERGITWNYQPAVDCNTILDYQDVTEQAEPFSWNITETVRRWYAADIPGVNHLQPNGIALIAPEAEASRSGNCALISSDSDTGERPILYIFYFRNFR